MRFPTNSARATPLNPVLLLIRRGPGVDYLRTKLRRLGGSVVSVDSISAAVALFSECSSFDAVVISADRPESGWEMARELRNVGGIAAPVCIVCDRRPALALRREARAGGVQFFRKKEGVPWLLDSLVRRTLDRLTGLAITISELLQPELLATVLLDS